MSTKDTRSTAATGVPGLDDILSGGLTRGSLFLLEGSPGTGKTTIAIRYLLEGARAGESNLYITLSETKQELLNGAASHGWDLNERIDVFELQPSDTAPLVRFQGVLRGVTNYFGEFETLLKGAKS